MEKTYYELAPSQVIVKTQCQYTLDKRVINILAAMSTENELDFALMEKAFNLVVERNDCLRLKFEKKDGELKQYFRESVVFNNIPVLTFKTEKEQNDFILKIRKTPTKYKKGEVVVPYFIKTYDNKYMVFLKVCHLILDVYGIGIIYKDLFGVYDALKNNTELPECPASFEKLLIKDIARKNNKELTEKVKKYLTDVWSSKEPPYYASIHDNKQKDWKKALDKNIRSMKYFFFRNNSEGYVREIGSDIVEKALAYCEDKKLSPANFFFYTMMITSSMINGKLENMLPLVLCNCRGTIAEKKCAGSKVQQSTAYVSVDYNKSFDENFESYCQDQTEYYKHIDLSPNEVAMLLKQVYGTSLLRTYYGITYSFIPVNPPKGYEFMVFNNGKFALSAYIGQLFDVENKKITMAYDCQTVVIDEKAVDSFHKKYLEVLNQIISDTTKPLRELK